MENSHGAVRMTFLKDWILKQSAVKSRCFESGRATPLPRTCLLPFRARDPFRLGCYCAGGVGAALPVSRLLPHACCPDTTGQDLGVARAKQGHTLPLPVRCSCWQCRARPCTRIGMRHVHLSVVRGDTGVSGRGQLINRSFVPF